MKPLPNTLPSPRSRARTASWAAGLLAGKSTRGAARAKTTVSRRSTRIGVRCRKCRVPTPLTPTAKPHAEDRDAEDGRRQRQTAEDGAPKRTAEAAKPPKTEPAKPTQRQRRTFRRPERRNRKHRRRTSKHLTNIPRYPMLSDEPVEFVVDESEAGQRLDVLLSLHFHNYSRGHLRRVISAGGVHDRRARRKAGLSSPCGAARAGRPAGNSPPGPAARRNSFADPLRRRGSRGGQQAAGHGRASRPGTLVGNARQRPAIPLWPQPEQQRRAVAAGHRASTGPRHQRCDPRGPARSGPWPPGYPVPIALDREGILCHRGGHAGDGQRHHRSLDCRASAAPREDDHGPRRRRGPHGADFLQRGRAVSRIRRGASDAEDRPDPSDSRAPGPYRPAGALRSGLWASRRTHAWRAQRRLRRYDGPAGTSGPARAAIAVRASPQRRDAGDRGPLAGRPGNRAGRTEEGFAGRALEPDGAPARGSARNCASRHSTTHIPR